MTGYTSLHKTHGEIIPCGSCAVSALSFHHVMNQKHSKKMVAMSHQISGTVIVVSQKYRLLPAISDTCTVVVIVVRLTKEATDGLTDRTALFVVMYQMLVHLRISDPLRIHDSIVRSDHIVTAHTVIG